MKMRFLFMAQRLMIADSMCCDAWVGRLIEPLQTRMDEDFVELEIHGWFPDFLLSLLVVKRNELLI